MFDALQSSSYTCLRSVVEVLLHLPIKSYFGKNVKDIICSFYKTKIVLYIFSVPFSSTIWPILEY